MKYAILHQPEIDMASADAYAQKFDPHYYLMGLHITFVFPFAAKSLEQLTQDIATVTQATRPFIVKFDQLKLSWDQWLYLIPTVGGELLDKLHDDLYVLPQIREHYRADIPFEAHISVGHFALPGSGYKLFDPKKVPLDAKKYAVARKEAEQAQWDFEYPVSNIELHQVSDDFQDSSLITKFPLS